MLNQTVGNFRVISLLGEGGMGVVYLAQHPEIGRKAAIKVLHPELARRPDVVTRFFNEARAANAIRHPGIVDVFDFGTLPDGATYITMEFLEGESLAARLKRVVRLPIAEAVEVASQIASALAAAHAAGIVHRDLKPDNLFLLPDPHTPERPIVKVLDFGIAKLSVDTSGSGSVKTRTGTVMGTPSYMSPEQCRGTTAVDHRTDIYALGIILYEMICGQPPFISAGYGDLINMHIAAAPVSPRVHAPGVSPELEKVMLKLLAKDRGERTQSMGDLQRALKANLGKSVSTPDMMGETMSATPIPPRSDLPVHTTFTTAASMIEGEAAPTGRKWGTPALVATLVVAGIVAAATLSGKARDAKTIPAPASPVAAPIATPVAPEQPPAISVKISSTPAGARLVREKDGANIGVTPFDEAWPQGQGVEKLELELEGYLPEPFAVPLDRGVELSFPLTKVPSAAPKHKRSAPHETPEHKGTPELSEPVPL